MADEGTNEERIDPVSEEGAEPGLAVQAEPEPKSEDATNGDTSEPEDSQDDHRVDRPTSPGPVREDNRSVVGTLVLHFDHRDVRVLLDGDTGLRALDAIRRKDSRKGDRLSIYTSTAETYWVVFRPSEVLAGSWLPGIPDGHEGIALDPPAVS